MQNQQKGYVLGNPGTDVDIDPNYRVPFAHGMALICDELYEVWRAFVLLAITIKHFKNVSIFLKSLKRTCGENYINVDPRNAECLKLTTNFKKV